jgi:thiol-disulfide isomerase/thioredoxin
MPPRPVHMTLKQLAATCLFVLGGCREPVPARGADTASVAVAAAGSMAPRFVVATLGGDSARIGGESRQPVTLVNIWATWCGPCKAEFPELQRLHEEYGPRGLRLLAVSIDSEADSVVEASARSMRVTFPIGRDPNDEVRGKFGAIGIPESWLISSDGDILWRHSGAIAAGDTAVRRAIKAALTKAGS